MMSMIRRSFLRLDMRLDPERHDVMIVDPIQNILVDRESGEPLMIDFGRGRSPLRKVSQRLLKTLKDCFRLS